MKYKITNRYTGEVQFTAEIECDERAPVGVKIGLAAKWAIKAGANLAGANLAGADLADANLADANLAWADLADANLAGANLAGANLAEANLAGADLADANLAWANLAGANLIDGGQDTRGYRFVGHVDKNGFMILAGRRYLTLAEALEHWAKSPECLARVKLIEAVAIQRGMVK